MAVCRLNYSNILFWNKMEQLGRPAMFGRWLVRLKQKLFPNRAQQTKWKKSIWER